MHSNKEHELDVQPFSNTLQNTPKIILIHPYMLKIHVYFSGQGGGHNQVLYWSK